MYQVDMKRDQTTVIISERKVIIAQATRWKIHTCKSTGIACLWIGVGSLNPSSATLRNKYFGHLYL